MASSGNFCTLNPLAQPNAGTYSEGNLLFTHTASAWRTSFGTHGITSGKWYWEAYQYEDIGTGNGFPLGIYDQDSGQQAAQAAQYPGQSNSSYGTGYVVYSSGTKRNNGSETSISSGTAVGTWQCAFDADNGKIWFGKDNTWADSGDPAGGSNEAFSSIPSSTWVPITCSYSDSSSENYPQNFGQDSTFAGRLTAGGNADGNGFGDFKYAPPTGFLALCSANLSVSDDIDPAQTDDDYPSKQFNAVTYTGNGSTQSINVGFQPDFLWFKNRGTANSWVVFDSTRGTTKTLNSNSSHAESTGGYTNLDAFTSTGFDLDGGGTGDVNQSSASLLAYCWRANGGTTSSNTDGSITSTVQANTKAGFSICTYTGNGSGGATFGHGLSAKPSFVIIKNRDASQKWAVWHQSAGMTDYKLLFLSESSALTTEGTQRWDISAISSSVFGLGSHPEINGSGVDYVSYIWHDIEGFQKFGTYEGNGSTDGTFVYTGFRPRMVFLKQIDGAAEWAVYDTARDTFNEMGKCLEWDLGASEKTHASDLTTDAIMFFSNGFKLTGGGGGRTNQSGRTYVFGAWADVSFKYNNTF